MTSAVAILGHGAWGTALGRTLADAGTEVRFWRRGESADVLSGAEMVLSAISAQATLSGKGSDLSSISTLLRNITNRTPSTPPTSMRAVLSQ